MKDHSDSPAVDLQVAAAFALARVIAEHRRSAPDADTCIACAIVEMMRSPELEEHLGEAAFEALRTSFRERLAQFARNADYVTDLEGARFCIALPELTSHDQLELAATRLKQLLAPPMVVADNTVLVQANAGFSITRLESARPAALVQAADSALARCSPAERYVICDPALLDRTAVMASLGTDLEAALHNGELVPEFQPVHDTGHGNITAAAATLVWKSPQHGQQPFVRYTVPADECRMLRPVYGRFIADVLDQATAWPESIGVVLPLPTELLHDDEVVHEVHAALQRYGLAPARLTIDVHEAALSKVETRVVLANLRQRKIGIRVSGVGEGGLPLALLGNLPIDEVAFTRSLLGKSPPLAMRTLLFELFRRAGYRLVATDIRDEKLISRLKDLGFHAVQGPAMGAAPTAESFATWLQRKA